MGTGNVDVLVRAVGGRAARFVVLAREALHGLSPPPTIWLDVLVYTELREGGYEPMWRWKIEDAP